MATPSPAPTATTAAEATPSAVPASLEGRRVVQRTLMRGELELDVRSLYLWAVTSLGSGDPSSDAAEQQSKNKQATNYQQSDVGLQGYARITDDDTVVVEPGRRVTFGAYFNAFPAAYWRRWSDLTHVRLRVEARGEGTLIVYRSTARGHVLRTESVELAGTGSAQEVVLDLPLAPFIDGGWYWFDLEGGETEIELLAADWSFPAPAATSRLSIGITTFNRPDFCTAQLVALSRSPEVLAIVDEIIVVDQGTQQVADDPGFPAVAAALGDKLRVLRQPNLGGSGGFSRAMFETVAKGSADYLLLLDDDVVCELEGILRAVAFADLAKQTTLVGGHMFSLYDRTVMHAYGESIGKWRWFWGPAAPSIHSHDWARIPLRSTKWLHRRIDVDYNGWWMCLIPTEVIRTIGLSAPMFIKWDDAEFGLRAGRAGFPTVSLPGAAVWHVPWTEKDDTIDWQAYFHQRNRLISALLHSPYEHGGRLVQESAENHVKRLMAMQYSAGEIIMLAIEDVLAGPERMHRDMKERLAEIRAIRQQHADAQPRTDLDVFPVAKLEKPRRKDRGVPNPTDRVGKIKMAATGLVRQVTKPREFGQIHPEAVVPHVDQKWYRLAHFDSAIVSAADGVSAAWHKRDRAEFSRQLRRSTALHARLYKEWPALAARYRDAMPTITSPEAWAETFGIDGGIGGGIGGGTGQAGQD
ncbi:glycosyltransferase [Nocardioides sp.]|uniref:glycosyltransferase n=1 Tax=Nocardioides sp. TaxID=35761 RepID=UPI003510EAAB